MAARPSLFSDEQNMYNRVVLVCTANVYIPTSLGGRPILRYLQSCTHFTYSVRTDSYVCFREYCKQFEILSAIFITRSLNIDSKKHNLAYSPRLDFYLLYLGSFLIYFISFQTNRKGQTSPKVPVVPGT
jgi:hypothetical protein